ncbi:hypothetical protein JZM40_15320 [Acinetobacter pittii]|uniref:Uncharacterized protein n=1 Tax=Acinetobacter haemolyticus TaxID=29430 RepID=A0AAW4J7A7_ACIHA|nr:MULTISPECIES: hypothetical protein [Acinetobacter]MBN6533002.1 hypothetical protein [Acinetobacter pittii]MBO3656939.1 hypothetical protein [Acinetobacter haemolyticus]
MFKPLIFVSFLFFILGVFLYFMSPSPSVSETRTQKHTDVLPKQVNHVFESKPTLEREDKVSKNIVISEELGGCIENPNVVMVNSDGCYFSNEDIDYSVICDGNSMIIAVGKLHKNDIKRQGSYMQSPINFNNRIIDCTS